MEEKKLYGETYFKGSQIREFVEQCTIKNETILCVEFFKIIGDKIIPFQLLQSIDSASLYDENISREENTKRCNQFIKSCIDKQLFNLEDLYFSAVIETDNEI